VRALDPAKLAICLAGFFENSGRTYFPLSRKPLARFIREFGEFGEFGVFGVFGVFNGTGGVVE
jgi:hypothetical protein